MNFIQPVILNVSKNRLHAVCFRRRDVCYCFIFQPFLYLPLPTHFRRLSLRCAHSTGSNSSGSTSGLGSSLSTTSFIVVDDNSVESSRRSSQNTCSSDVGDVFRPAAQSTVGHLSTTDEVFLSSWTGTTNFGLSTAGGGSAPRPLLGSEPVFTSTRHSSSGPRCIDPRGEIAQNLIEHFSTLGLDSPGSAGM